MPKYVFVTGGVVSSVGKGVVSACLGTLLEAAVMSVALSNVNVFAGVGGSLDSQGTPDDYSDDTVSVEGGLGFNLTGGSLALAVVKPSGLGAGDETSYMGLEIGLAGATLVGVEGLTFIASGSVLINKATDAAGAVVTGESAQRAESLGLDMADYLLRNDAYHFFEKLDDLIRTGPSGTNVNDLVILIAI